MGGAAGTEEYRNTEFLMKKLLKWLWYSVLGLAALAIVLIILFFILIFVSGPPVNEESDKRNTTELLRDVDENFEFIKYKINTIEDNNNYCGIIISIPHDIFKIINLKKINKNGLEKCVVFDLKNLYKNTNESWRL